MWFGTLCFLGGEVASVIWKLSWWWTKELNSDHEVFATEDDPETEERGVEDALLHVLKQQHPRPLEAEGEPLHRNIQEGHGDTQSENHPERGKDTLQWLKTQKQERDAASTVLTWFFQADHALNIKKSPCVPLSTRGPEALHAS